MHQILLYRTRNTKSKRKQQRLQEINIMPAINVCAMECACFGTKSMLYTYRQRSISTLFPEIVLLLLDFQHGMLSICHHLQSTARNLIRSDLLCWLSHPARKRRKKLRMKQKMKSNTKCKIFIENSKQFFSFSLKLIACPPVHICMQKMIACVESSLRQNI